MNERIIFNVLLSRMSTQKSKDPYAAFRVKEFKSFLVIRFAMVFAWSMQFIVIEWEVYNITKDPLSLGLIGLLEIVPSLTVALFAGHFVDQNENRYLISRALGVQIPNPGSVSRRAGRDILDFSPRAGAVGVILQRCHCYNFQPPPFLQFPPRRHPLVQVFYGRPALRPY